MKICGVKFALLLMVASISIVGCRGVEAHPPAAGAETPSAQQLPFTGSKPLVVPANSAIYVRLQESLSSANAREGQTFSAVLDQPLVVDDQTIAPEGTAVTGTVVAVRESGRLHNAGYLRIALTSITLNGKPALLQTNSVFVGGDRKRSIAITGNGKSIPNVTISKTDGSQARYGKKQVGFGTDFRLGFRLTQPLNVS